MALHPLLARLREETQPQHRQAERQVRILDPDATAATYRHYLLKMLGFHAPLEEAFAAHRGLAAAGWVAEERRKAPLLLADLRALEGLGGAGGAESGAACPEPQGFRCHALPDVAGLPEALGCAYVLEGSTLGGQYILKHLGGALPELRSRATSFLEGYGSRTGAMWKAFGTMLVDHLVTDGEQDLAVRSAQRTFTAMTAWLEHP